MLEAPYILKLILSIFALIVCQFRFTAQEPVLKNFSTRNGLPSNEVYFLLSDSKGYVWICTDAGLVKYNGNSFKSFDSGNGMPDNTIFEVKEDKLGRIWFRSFAGKMGYVANDSVYTIGANSKIEEFAREGIISSFAFDEEGSLYLGKTNSEAISFLKIVPPFSQNNVSEVWVNTSTSKAMDVVLIGKNDFVFSDSRGLTLTYPVNIYTSKHELILSENLNYAGRAVYSKIIRNGNILYLTINNLLKRFDLKSKAVKETRLENIIISTVLADSNIIMVGEIHKGIRNYSESLIPKTEQTLLQGLTFTSFTKDYQGGNWFATHDAGVFYMHAQNLNFFVKDDTKDYITFFGTLTDTVLCTGYNSGDIMFTSFAGSGRVKNRIIYTDLKKLVGRIHCVTRLPNNKILASGNLGSLEIDLKTRINKPVLKIDNKTSIYHKKVIKYRDSLIFLRLEEITATHKDSIHHIKKRYNSAHRLTSIVFDSTRNQIYLSSLRGVYKFNFSDKLSENDKIIDSRVDDMKLAEGKLYMATKTHGLIIKSGNKLDTLNQKKGLLSNICKSICIDGNTIWVGTNKGICKIIYSDEINFSVQNYPLGEVIDAPSVEGVCKVNNKIFFYSGPKIYFFDNDLKKKPAQFRVSNLYVNHKPVNKTNNLALEFQSSVSVYYEALFFDCTNPIQYRYKVNKADTLWKYTNENFLSFSNIVPGEYSIWVEAKNSRGEWINLERPIVFSIDKPFWRKAWFIIIVLTVFTLSLMAFIGFRYRRVMRKTLESNALKVKIQDLETKAAKAQMNPHFIFNSLNSIQQFILANDNEKAYTYLVKFSKLVRMLLESNTNECLTLEVEIEILKKYIEIESLRFDSAFKCDFIIDKSLIPSQIKIPHMLIQPFVENAIWHGLLHKKENKNLEISFHHVDDKLILCTVEDNGVGIKSEKKDELGLNIKKSLALEFIKQRLELLNKTTNVGCGLEICDKEDLDHTMGTIVNIKIPILN